MMLRIITWKSTVCYACWKRFEPTDTMVVGFKAHGVKGVPYGMRFTSGVGMAPERLKADAGKERT
jgi:hypothetical protein